MPPAPTSPLPKLVLPFLDQPGNDLAIVPGIPTADECLQRCLGTSGCAGVVHGPAPQTCWLKAIMPNLGVTFTGPGAGQRTIARIGNGAFGSTLQGGVPLLNSMALVSPNGQWAFLMQTDNNAVVYDLSAGKATWATGTAGKGQGPAFVSMEADSALKVRDQTGGSIWASGTAGGTAAPYTLSLQDGGVLVVTTAAGSPVWTSAGGALVTNPPATAAPVTVATIVGPAGTITITQSQLDQRVYMDAGTRYSSITVAAGYLMYLSGPNYHSGAVSSGTWNTTFTNYDTAVVSKKPA